jgi:Nucleotidyl transferase AbiEii toxin, Type IV TA system
MNPGFLEILKATAEEQRDLFLGAARRLGTPEQNIEKDFWVCWILDALFNGLEKGGPRLLFKGGTSLSKAFGLISRFSEDIDITVFRDDLGQPASLADLETLSGKKRRAKLDAIKGACQEFIQGALVTGLNRLIEKAMEEAGIDTTRVRLALDEEDPDRQSLLFWYPTATTQQEGYVRPAVKIEAGAKSALDPHQTVTIKPFVAEEIPRLSLAVANITTVAPERTFWDKVLMLHGLRRWYEKRGVIRHEGQRVSRHYYDVHCLAQSESGERALSDLDLALDCSRHAHMFFGSPDLDLATARPGSFALAPDEGMIRDLRRDYERMSGMIIGPAPGFENVIDSIRTLQDRLNRHADTP